MFQIYRGSNRLQRVVLVRALLVVASIALVTSMSGVAAFPTAAQIRTGAADLAALTIRPNDLEDPGWRHQGAYFHSVWDQARDYADYVGRGTDEDEVAERLTGVGWQRQYVSYLSLPSKADPALPEMIVRSYVTEYVDADGAATGFTFLEDESLIPGATDVPLNRVFGDESEMTAERGISSLTGRQFRSIDLSFRYGNLVAGLTLIQYPTTDRLDPDTALAEALATIIESRVARAPEIPSGLGARVVHLDHDQHDVVTFDDAYYRVAGMDIPIEGESPDAAGARIDTYAEAVDVYQLWQGVNSSDVESVLYGVTMLNFADAESAEAWLTDLAGILATNPFYGDLRPEESNATIGDQTVVLSYASGGGGPTDPRALIVAVRVGADVARLHLVPQGNLESVPMPALMELVTTQAACLAQTTTCTQPVPVPASLLDAIT